MTRKKLLVGTGCLLSIVAFTTIAMTQDDIPRSRRALDPAQPPVFDSDSRPAPSADPRSVDTLYYPSAQTGGPVAYRPKRIARTVYEEVHVAVSAEELKQIQALQAAKEKLKKAQDDTARKAATEVIQRYLVKQFDQDLAQREKELASVEERVKTLRQQLDKRKQAKDEIVSLRLKTIVNNAEGLGFPGDEDLRLSGEDTGFGQPVYPSQDTFDPEAAGNPRPQFRNAPVSDDEGPRE